MSSPFLVLPKNIPALDAAIPRAMEAFDVKGLTAAVIHGNEIVYQKCFGFADAETGRRMDEFTHVEAASLTKPMFAYVVLKLVAEGLFDLDRPLVTYPVEPPTDDARVRLLTARHVLTHSSGFPNWGEIPLSMLFTPGNGFHYSGEGYSYLQRVMEKLTGKRLDHLMQDEIFNPYRMEHPALVWTGPLNRTLAVSYDENGNPEPLRSTVFHRIGYYEPNAAFSLYAGVTDYPKFLISAVDEAYAQRVLETLNPAVENVNWGLGWGEFHGALWHWGDNGGYKSFVCRNAKTGDGVVVHTNSFSGLSACHAVLDTVTDTDFSDVFAFIATAE